MKEIDTSHCSKGSQQNKWSYRMEKREERIYATM